MTITATLDGLLLPVDAGTTWPLIDGVDGYEATLTLEATSGEELFSKAKRHGSKLRLSSGGKSETYRKLTILGTGPGPTPYQREVVVADRRWTWSYGPMVRRSYNVPRKSGGVRRSGNDGEPLAVRNLIADLAFYPWSLKGKGESARAWEAAEIVKDVLDLVVPGEWTDRDGVLEGAAGKLPEIQNLVLSAVPSVAIGQVLAELGGRVGLFVRPSGEVVLYDRLSGDERELVGAPGAQGGKTRDRSSGPKGFPQIVGGPLWEVQDRRMERPSAIRVLFVPACELRVDHLEAAAAAGTEDGTPLRTSSVLRYPEDVTAGGRVVVESTWGTFPEFFEFLATQTLAGFPALTLATVLKGYLHGLPEAYAFVDGTGVWASRAAAIREHLRRTYRITRPWVDRIRALRAYRVSIEDRETGSQGVSLVYQDYAEWPTWRGTKSKSANDPPAVHEQVRNRYSNPAAASGGQIVGTALASLRAAPAQLSIVDEELGILSVDFVFDFTGTASRYVHSALVKDRLPTSDPSKRHCYLQEGHLSTTHEVSYVVTAQPATPNDERQLYPVEVTLADVSNILPTNHATEAEGPVLEILVDASRELARFQWDDAKSAAIYAAFDEVAEAGAEGAQTLAEAYGDPINATVLEAIAKATAARVYVSFEDHLEGGLLTGWTPGLEPRGTAKSISHSFGPDGPRTMIDLPPKPPVVSEEPFLPTSVQKLLGRFVDP